MTKRPCGTSRLAQTVKSLHPTPGYADAPQSFLHPRENAHKGGDQWLKTRSNHKTVHGDLQMRRVCEGDANEGKLDEKISVQSGVNAMGVNCEGKQKTETRLVTRHFANVIEKGARVEMWIFAELREWGYCSVVSSPEDKDVRDIADSLTVRPGHI